MSPEQCKQDIYTDDDDDDDNAPQKKKGKIEMLMSKVEIGLLSGGGGS
jgi:hypothetical protein